MTEMTFNVIAENPQIPHVEGDVGESHVEKLGRDERQQRRQMTEIDSSGNECPRFNEPIQTGGGEFQNKDPDIHDNDADRDNGEAG